MTTFKVTTVINKPVDIVVKALMNPDNFPFWQKDLGRKELQQPTPSMVMFRDIQNQELFTGVFTGARLSLKTEFTDGLKSMR